MRGIPNLRSEDDKFLRMTSTPPSGSAGGAREMVLFYETRYIEGLFVDDPDLAVELPALASTLFDWRWCSKCVCYLFRSEKCPSCGDPRSTLNETFVKTLYEAEEVFMGVHARPKAPKLGAVLEEMSAGGRSPTKDKTLSSKLCLNGCGNLQARSPVDGKFHCLTCGSAFTQSQLTNNDVIHSKGFQERLIRASVEQDGLGEAMARSIAFLDVAASKVRESQILKWQKVLRDLHRHMEEVSRVELPLNAFLATLYSIYLWGDDDDDARDGESDPEPEKPRERELV